MHPRCQLRLGEQALETCYTVGINGEMDLETTKGAIDEDSAANELVSARAFSKTIAAICWKIRWRAATKADFATVEAVAIRALSGTWLSDGSRSTRRIWKTHSDLRRGHLR